MEIPAHISNKSREYLTNISESVAFVLRSLIQVEAAPRKIYNRRLSSLPNDLIISIDYSADLIGYFSFFFSLKTAFEICNRLMPGINNEYFDNEHLDIIGEVGNMIAGNTMGKLKSISTTVDLSTPYLSGFHKILASEKLFWVFSCNYEIEIGKLGVLFAIKK